MTVYFDNMNVVASNDLPANSKNIEKPAADPQVEPQVEPQVDPVPSEEGEEDVPLAAAALAVPALAAFGFRKRLRGKHARIM